MGTLNMLPTTAIALSAAQLAHVFENGACFLMTSIQHRKRAHPTISPKPPLPEGVPAQREPWLLSLTGNKNDMDTCIFLRSTTF